MKKKNLILGFILFVVLISITFSKPTIKVNKIDVDKSELHNDLKESIMSFSEDIHSDSLYVPEWLD